MLLIAEIILTIFAWRAGWKWLALIPVGVAFLIGFIIGTQIDPNTSLTDLSWLSILDVVAIGALKSEM
jgi:hypothetical protein